MFTPPPPPRAKVVWNCNVDIVYGTSSLRILKIMPRNLNEIVLSWIQLLCIPVKISVFSMKRSGCLILYILTTNIWLVFPFYRRMNNFKEAYTVRCCPLVDLIHSSANTGRMLPPILREKRIRKKERQVNLACVCWGAQLTLTRRLLLSCSF